jgi:phosphoribosylformylglycinamidine synthase
MKFGVLIFPGSNCDHDMVYTLKTVLKQEVVELWHKDVDLQNVDAIAIPGGFSFGDYLRSGAIAKFSPIMEKVIEFANNGGFVFGICNGFQILCESGLLPGALLHNENQKFISKNIYLKPDNNNTNFTSLLNKNRAYKIPIAHGEGKYFANEDVLAEMRQNDQILFRYCDKEGKVNNNANPNGSIENIAGICNKNKNVYGMMPHPERASDETLKNTDGKEILESMIKTLMAQKNN